MELPVIQFRGALTGIGIATAMAYSVFFVLSLRVVIVLFDGSALLFCQATVQMLVPSANPLGYALAVSNLVVTKGGSLLVDTAVTALVLSVAVLR